MNGASTTRQCALTARSTLNLFIPSTKNAFLNGHAWNLCCACTSKALSCEQKPTCVRPVRRMRY